MKDESSAKVISVLFSLWRKSLRSDEYVVGAGDDISRCGKLHCSQSNLCDFDRDHHARRCLSLRDIIRSDSNN